MKISIKPSAAVSMIFPLVACILIFNMVIHPSQSQNQLKQEVTVTAVEVPVRVLRGGQIVKDLKKEDFEIYENGSLQYISAFDIISRKIAGPPPGAVPATVEVKPKPRLFLLIFNIFDYNEAVGEAIDYFFQNVFRAKDKLVIITENHLLNLNTLDKTGEIVRGLKETLKRFKVISRQNITRAHFRLKSEGDTLLNMLHGVGLGDPQSWEDQVIHFYDNYLQFWQSYRSQFLTPDANLYEGLIKRTMTIDAEKWAICFQQRDLFPVLRSEGRLEKEINQLQSRRVQNKQRDLQQEFDLSKNFPSDKLKNLFMRYGITFHLILMKSIRTLGDEDFELREVAQDYEDCFREISRSTNGYLTFSNKVLDALKEASEKEDYHYLLVYQPKGPIETRGKNIEVRIHQPGVKVYNLKEYINLTSPIITISDVVARAKSLKFRIKNYAKLAGEKGKLGNAEVRVTLYDAQSNIAFSEGNNLDLIKDELNISLNLGKLQAGAYFLIIEATDKISNEKDVYSGMIEL